MVMSEVNLGVLDQEISPVLVDEVVAAAGRRERRRRLLPARVVVYFVLALCLFSGADSAAPPGYRSVMRSLSAAVRHLHGLVVPSSAALTKARRRLGAEPLRLLFDRSRGVLAAPGTPGASRFGRRLVAWDGTIMDVAHTPENVAAFGYLGSEAGYPQIRLLALIECGTRAVVAAAFDGAKQASEPQLARQVLTGLGPGMLLLADRNFAGHDLWEQTTATGADLLWRAKTRDTFVPGSQLPDGSYTSVMATAKAKQRYRVQAAWGPGWPAPDPIPGYPIRVIEYTVTATDHEGNTRTEDYRLITTLLDHEHAPAHALAAAYHERWESETGFGELKNRLRGAGFILRSKSPELVRQELYAFLITYQALCRFKHAAAQTAGLDCDRVSFTVTIRTIRDHIGRPRSVHARQLAITDILTDLLPPRRPRSYPRTKKQPKNRFPPTRIDQRRPPANINYKITIKQTARSPATTP